MIKKILLITFFLLSLSGCGEMVMATGQVAGVVAGIATLGAV